MTINNVKTKSFAGDDPVNGKSYEWVGKFSGETNETNFRIIVKEAPDESDFPYYVYFAKDDAAIVGTKYESMELRIMPIVDVSVGEPNVTSSSPVKTDSVPSDLSTQNTSYLANSNKWNPLGSNAPIKSWYIVNPDTSNDKDIVITKTSTESLMQAPMETSFYFMEYLSEKGEIKPAIKFKNKSTETLINMFLYQNGSDQRSVFGDSAEKEWKYCFYLTERESN